MTEPKPVASLNPRLLARKGGARPAMRQAMTAVAIQSGPHDLDDLGWNDMGHHDGNGAVVAIHGDAAVPEVVRQQRHLAREIAGERRSALANGRRAAFTLRVDADRHLKLRLACTIKGRSAQQLVTEALDRLLAETPDIADLAAQVTKKRK